MMSCIEFIKGDKQLYMLPIKIVTPSKLKRNGEILCLKLKSEFKDRLQIEDLV